MIITINTADITEIATLAGLVYNAYLAREARLEAKQARQLAAAVKEAIDKDRGRSKPGA